LNRRYAIGVEIHPNGGVHARVWAPHHPRVAIVDRDSTGREQWLEPEGNGHHSGLVPFLGAGSRYSFRLEESLHADPASRFQPDGPRGPSEVVDPGAFVWEDREFVSRTRAAVLYELHVGTFTQAGTYLAAAAQLPELANLGVTIVQVMPVASYPGKFGWGYDGEYLWAPSENYGTPDALRTLVATAHAHGIQVLLDTVYNHMGSRDSLAPFAPEYFSDRYQSEWGNAFNFDGPGSAAVRQFVCENARYWLEEFHFDGLRLDATQQLFDESEPHILSQISRTAHAAAAKLGKTAFLVGENEPQDSKLLEPREAGGAELDALLNDDFHHSVRAALTGRRDGYYSDFRGSPQELVSAAKWGFLFQGQRSFWQNKRRGSPNMGQRADRIVCFLQNHDQVANSLRGERLDRLTSPSRLRAATVILLLGPQTPLLFQGQEFAASAPFLFFADLAGERGLTTQQQRQQFLAQFPALASPEAQEHFERCTDFATFARCKLDFAERAAHAHIYALHRDLLQLRHEDPVLNGGSSEHVHGFVLGEQAFGLRFSDSHGDRLLLVNLGPELMREPRAEPMLAPPRARDWRLLFCSEDIRYGGSGFAEPWQDGSLALPAECAALLTADGDEEP